MALAVTAVATVTVIAVIMAVPLGVITGMYAGPVCPIPPDVASGNNAFAVDFYRQLSGDDDGSNILFSPVGVYLASSMLYDGIVLYDPPPAMDDSFGFATDEDSRHRSVASLTNAVDRNHLGADLTVANALWIAHLFNPHEKYLDTVRNLYGATAEKVYFDVYGETEDSSWFGGDPTENVGFPDDGRYVVHGVKKANDWASGVTGGKIPEVLVGKDVNLGTSMVLTSVASFVGSWEAQFLEEGTAASRFYKDDTQSVTVDFMNMRGDFCYAHSDSTHMLLLPYEDERLSMLVMLPDDTSDINSLGKSISEERIFLWVDNLEVHDVKVSMPKFEIGTRYTLTDKFQSMIRSYNHLDALSAVSDESYLMDEVITISGIPIPRTVHLSLSSHDAYVAVSEGDARAAPDAFAPKPDTSAPVTYFNADRPFVFVIYDEESGAILFMGRVSDPVS